MCNRVEWMETTYYVIKKIAIACYALRNIKYFMPSDTLKLIYFVHIHSIMSYGIIIWSGSSCVNKVFILQKKAIRIIMNSRPKEFFRDLFIQ
jgi:hypothetical protein